VVKRREVGTVKMCVRMVHGSKAARAGHLAIEKQSGTDGERVVARRLGDSEHEPQWADQVRVVAQHPLAFSQRLADEAELAVFEVAQPAVDDASGSAGRPGSEVVLLDEQGPHAGAGA